ncbi:unnamed protein product [Microthlaspi erraticum]|uniref:Transcriptional factor DELLA N-terminal domain-containing protein n=1 Tax=Microthlaspi erraticum TaxID=1685480 RepID=A0A6D2KL20_9BRAS|nr:unnamed protein product [Microthlaspi erraticum]
MMGNVEEDDLSHLATDTVHYNPSELYLWLDNMLSELNPSAVADPVSPSPEINLTGAGDSSTITSIGGFSTSDFDMKAIPGNAMYRRSNQFVGIDSSSSSNQVVEEREERDENERKI